MKMTTQTNLFTDVNYLGNDWIEYTGDEQVFQEIHDYFISLFPDSQIRNSMYRLLSDCVTRQTDDKKLYYWVGRGSNGKTTFANFIQSVFGKYCCSDGNYDEDACINFINGCKNFASDIVKIKSGIRVVISNGYLKSKQTNLSANISFDSITFQTVFVENPTNNNQLVSDEHIIEKFNSWIQPFRWLLVNKINNL